MRGFPFRLGAARRAASLLLVGLALAWLAASRQDGLPDDAAAQPLAPDICLGDEVITFATNPRLTERAVTGQPVASP